MAIVSLQQPTQITLGSIITAVTHWAVGEIVLGLVLWKALQQGCNGAGMKTMARRETFTRYYRGDPTLLCRYTVEGQTFL
jgi:hypothetical protein